MIKMWNEEKKRRQQRGKERAEKALKASQSQKNSEYSEEEIAQFAPKNMIDSVNLMHDAGNSSL